MRLYFEGYPYSLASLKDNIGNDIKLTLSGDGLAKISCVGYYYNAKINDTIFILPKIFVKDGIPFDIKGLDPENLYLENPLLKESNNDEAIFELSAWFYQAINHYYERQQNATTISDVQLNSTKSTNNKNSKTIIEIIIDLREFNKKHRNLFTYISLIKASGNNKVHWNKTISKVQPLIKDNSPYYLEVLNKNKAINFEEDLICLFYSVLNYLKQTYHFRFQQVPGFTILKASKIQSLIESGKGTRILKKIRRNYFTDELVELWNLMYIFFEREELLASGKAYNEKLLVSNFNLVFEDMIDQLISDDRKDLPKELYEQADGKLVDHIYKDKSLIDKEKYIYFIGDSKYYKDSADFGTNSIYKQFTYAKNVIQHNINALLKDKIDYTKQLYYRDSLTEGYDITPNFFIRGEVIDFNNINNQELKINKDSKSEHSNRHFFNRLFDRDTLFVQSYNINFMYVIASYVNNCNDISVKKNLKSIFRKEFTTFINSKFDFYELKATNNNWEEIVSKHFKKLNGKIYKLSKEEIIILALEKEFEEENNKLLLEINEDFTITRNASVIH